jgi:hypothetical protein
MTKRVYIVKGVDVRKLYEPRQKLGNSRTKN